MEFSEMLKEAREKAGLTQDALAVRTGLPLRSIQNWEQGHRVPRAEVVLTLAKAVGASAEQLLLAIAMDRAKRCHSDEPRREARPRGRRAR
jgi:transcriptional regulator with XRE-family HTH domain